MVNKIAFYLQKWLSYLSKVVKIVFVVDPSVIGGQAVGFVGDVLHVQPHAVVELPFKKLQKTR